VEQGEIRLVVQAHLLESGSNGTASSCQEGTDDQYECLTSALSQVGRVKAGRKWSSTCIIGVGRDIIIGVGRDIVSLLV
jgi:hypothetical protein